MGPMPEKGESATKMGGKVDYLQFCMYVLLCVCYHVSIIIVFCYDSILIIFTVQLPANLSDLELVFFVPELGRGHLSLSFSSLITTKKLPTLGQCRPP